MPSIQNNLKAGGNKRVFNCKNGVQSNTLVWMKNIQFFPKKRIQTLKNIGTFFSINWAERESRINWWNCYWLKMLNALRDGAKHWLESVPWQAGGWLEGVGLPLCPLSQCLPPKPPASAKRDPRPRAPGLCSPLNLPCDKQGVGIWTFHRSRLKTCDI